MLSSLRARRAVFWYLGPDRIVAALVSRAEREPVLEACAASYSAPVAGSRFAPGVVEVAWVLGCDKLVHVAALASSFCRVEACDIDAAPPGRRRRGSSTIRDSEGVAQRGSEGVAQHGSGGVGQRDSEGVAQRDSEGVAQRDSEGVALERRGAVSGAEGLRVWAEEGAVAQAAALFRRARLHLIALDCEPCALASLSEVLGSVDAEAARRQHLSAVAVLPESESAAEALGDDLAVPVGLAVAWFGVRRAV